MAPRMSDVAPGSAWGAFTIERRLGRGPSGTVYLAKETASGRAVTLKIFHPTLPAAVLDRFETDARRLAGFKHPSILAVESFGRHGEARFLVSEAFEGRNLRDLGSKPPREAAEIILQAARGLAAAWGRLALHRNLKPENVLVASDGRVRLSDFGFFLESTPYWSPERRQGRTPDLRGDLYSLGMLFKELLRDGSPDLDALVVHLTRPEAVERIQMVEDLIARLEGYLAAKPVEAPAPPAPLVEVQPPPPRVEAPPPPEPPPEDPALAALRKHFVQTVATVATREEPPVFPPPPRPVFRQAEEPLEIKRERFAQAVEAAIPRPARSKARGCIGCLVPLLMLGGALSFIVWFVAEPMPAIEEFFPPEPPAPVQAVPVVPEAPAVDEAWIRSRERIDALVKDMKYAEALGEAERFQASRDHNPPPEFSATAARLKAAVQFSAQAERALQRGEDLRGGDALRRSGPAGAAEADRILARWAEADWEKTRSAADQATAEENPGVAVRLIEGFLRRSHGGGARRAAAGAALLQHQAEADFQQLNSDLGNVPREQRTERAVAGWEAFLAKPHQGGARRAEVEQSLALAREDAQRTIYAGRFGIQNAALEPGSTRVAVYADQVRILDSTTREELWVLPIRPYGNRLAFAAGRLALAGSQKITRWKLEGKAEEAALAVTDGVVTAVGYSPDGKLLAAGTSGGTLFVWDAASGVVIRTEKSVGKGIQSLALSPDGRTLATGGWDKKVYLWALPSGAPRPLEGVNGRIGLIAWSPDGKRVAAAGSADAACVWDADSGDLRQTLKGHQGNLTALAWSADGGLLATGGMDSTIRLWSLQEGKAPQILKVSARRVTFVGFPPSGELLFGGDDGALRRIPLRD